MPSTVDQSISVSRRDVVDLLAMAEVYPELGDVAAGLEPAVSSVGSDELVLTGTVAGDWSLLVAGLRLRKPEETIVPTVSASPVSLLPIFLENPNWLLRFNQPDRHLYIELIETHQTAVSYFDKIASTMPENPDGDLQEQFNLIENRLQKTAVELNDLYSYPDAAYALDLLDRARIFMHRLDALARKVIDHKYRDAWHVKLPPGPTREYSPVQEDQTVTPAVAERPDFQVGDVIPALVNQAMEGMPPEMVVRPLQLERLRIARADIQRTKDFDLDYEATIIGPTGSGKTWDMMAIIHLFDAEWGINFDQGDKVYFAIHRKTGKKQIRDHILELIVPAFKRKYGREPNITFVDDKTHDHSGDFVICMIPSLTRNPDHTRLDMREEFETGGTIALFLLDEIHHGEAPTWKLARDLVREINLKVPIIGFTATPAGNEANPLIHTRAYELMQDGGLPDVGYLEVESGVSLDSLRTTFTGDFEIKTLSETINTEKRHRAIMHGLDEGSKEQGTRIVRNGKVGLAPTLIFGADLPHVMGIAQYYVKYFSDPLSNESELTGRSVKLIGAVEGKEHYPAPMSYEQVQKAIEAYKSGKIDALVAVVWGNMPDPTRDLILSEYAAGNIEAVVNCDVLGEMYDAPFVRNLVGAAPYLQPMRVFQQAGRFLRYQKDIEVSKNGVFLKAEKRLAIFIRDNLTDGRKVRTYREAYGLPFDLPLGLVHQLGKNPEPAEPAKQSGVKWDALLARLKEVLATEYNGDRTRMAHDLNGLDGEELLNRLAGEEIYHARNIVRRLATLLYADRTAFDEALVDDLADTPGYDEMTVMELLRMGLEIYMRNEKPNPEDNDLVAELPIDYGLELTTWGFKRKLVARLYKNQLAERAVNKLALGLYTYFSSRADGSSRAMVQKIGKQMDALRGNRFEWDNSLHGLREMPKEDFYRWLYSKRHKGEDEMTFVIYGRNDGILSDGRFKDPRMVHQKGSRVEWRKSPVRAFNPNKQVLLSLQDGQWILVDNKYYGGKALELKNALVESGKVIDPNAPNSSPPSPPTTPPSVKPATESGIYSADEQREILNSAVIAPNVKPSRNDDGTPKAFSRDWDMGDPAAGAMIMDALAHQVEPDVFHQELPSQPLFQIIGVSQPEPVQVGFQIVGARSGDPVAQNVSEENADAGRVPSVHLFGVGGMTPVVRSSIPLALRVVR